jgi:outer membrane protein assembly factor BamB
MKIFARTFFFVFIFSLSTASGDTVWRQYGFNAAHTSFNDNETILNRSNVSRLVHAWSVRVGQIDPSTPVLGFSNLFFSRGGHVTALKARSGNKLWESFSCFGCQIPQPALGQGVLIVGNTRGFLTGYEPSTGVPRWFVDVGGTITSAPAVKDGTIYVTNGVDAVAVDERSHRELWRFRPGDSIFLDNTPAVGNGAIYVTGARNNAVFALDQATGQKLWRHNLQTHFGTSAPSVANGIVYVGGDFLFALSAADGHLVWVNHSVGVDVSTPAIAYGKVFVDAEDPAPGLFAFNARDGSFVWQAEVADESSDAVTVANGVVYEMEEGQLNMFDAQDGSFLGSIAAPKGGLFDGSFNSQPVVANGTLYISTRHSSSSPGIVEAFRLP